MIDHVLGRPSVKFRKYQVLAVVSFWSLYLFRGNKHGPPYLRRISELLSSRLTAWQTLVLTLLYLYTSRNFGKLIGLECPEPLSSLYTRSFFRATWVTTALDAGFWSAMHIQPKWLKDAASIAFTVYYLICAEQADEKVRKVRSSLTVEHLRVSWNKPTTPYLSFVTRMMRPRLTRTRYPPRAIRIPRPKGSSYSEPVNAWLYFDGPISSLKKHDKIVLDIPGGGFVAMDPRCHDDKLIAWAGRTGVPVLALDYKKAPEHPYPYALNECYDVYHTLIASQGRCIGLSGDYMPKIVLCGDSAGGNLAVGLVLMILQSGSTDTRRWHGQDSLPLPEGLVLTYPGLDVNIGNWMTDEQMALIKDRRMRKINQGVLRRKTDDYKKLTPDTPYGSDNEDDSPSPPRDDALPEDITATDFVQSPNEPRTSAAHTVDTSASAAAKPRVLRTRLAMSSMISYFNDRILTPEMMRAMIILYIGPYSRPDFATDFLLSPVLAPEALLAKFPKTYMMTGERDPLVDDTVIFAGRLRQAKLAMWRERKELGLVRESEIFDETQHINVTLVPGISHGFFQFVGVFPEGWKYIFRCAKWIEQIFQESDLRDAAEAEAEEHEASQQDYYGRDDLVNNGGIGTSEHRRMRTGSSGDEDRPLEMSGLGKTSPKRRNRESRRAGPRPAAGRRNKSLVSLASSDDLLGRRMKGLTGALMGGEGVPETP